jgi:hypothetical protein
MALEDTRVNGWSYFRGIIEDALEGVHPDDELDAGDELRCAGSRT